jgi:hypothetical protein
VHVARFCGQLFHGLVITNAGHILLLVAKGGTKRFKGSMRTACLHKGFRSGEPDPERLALNACAREFRMETSIAAGAGEIRALANVAAGGRRFNNQPALRAIPNGISRGAGASCTRAPAFRRLN